MPGASIIHEWNTKMVSVLSIYDIGGIHPWSINLKTYNPNLHLYKDEEHDRVVWF